MHVHLKYRHAVHAMTGLYISQGVQNVSNAWSVVCKASHPKVQTSPKSLSCENDAETDALSFCRLLRCKGSYGHQHGVQVSAPSSVSARQTAVLHATMQSCCVL